MSVATVTEISAVSEEGFEDAIQQGIARATKTLRNVEGASNDEAIRHARAVATVLQTAVTGGELEDIRSQLGNGYEELFGQTGSSA
jgi:cation transport regulator